MRTALMLSPGGHPQAAPILSTVSRELAGWILSTVSRDCFLVETWGRTGGTCSNLDRKNRDRISRSNPRPAVQVTFHHTRHEPDHFVRTPQYANQSANKLPSWYSLSNGLPNFWPHRWHWICPRGSNHIRDSGCYPVLSVSLSSIPLIAVGNSNYGVKPWIVNNWKPHGITSWSNINKDWFNSINLKNQLLSR